MRDYIGVTVDRQPEPGAADQVLHDEPTAVRTFESRATDHSELTDLGGDGPAITHEQLGADLERHAFHEPPWAADDDHAVGVEPVMADSDEAAKDVFIRAL